MPLIPATQLRAGMTIQHENALWRVMAVTHVTPGNWRGMVQTKLRNLKTGTQTEHRFRSEDRRSTAPRSTSTRWSSSTTATATTTS